MNLLAQPEQPSMSVLATGIPECRAQLTQYISWVHSHTLPILRGSPGVLAKLVVQTDIDALDDIIERLILLLDEDGQKAAVPALLDHFAASVPLPGFRDRVLAMKAVWIDAKLGRPEEARDLLKDVDPRKTTDGPLLRAYMDIVGEGSHLSRLELLARIIDTSDQPVIRLQYTSLTALELWMMGEAKKARAAIDDAIASYAPEDTSGLDLYHVLWIARAHSFKWRIAEDGQEAEQAQSYYDRIPTDQLNDPGKAALRAEIGLLYSETGEYEKAIEHHAVAHEKDARCANRIHLAEAYLKSG